MRPFGFRTFMDAPTQKLTESRNEAGFRMTNGMGHFNRRAQMTPIDPATSSPAVGESGEAVDVPLSRTIVAVVVEWRGRLALFRRSGAVNHDRGRWHCVTGYLEAHLTREQQALLELHEETGLGVAALHSLEVGHVLHLDDGDRRTWRVHTFRAETDQRRLELNHEHDAYRWVRPPGVRRFGNRVSWLDRVLAAAHGEARLPARGQRSDSV